MTALAPPNNRTLTYHTNKDAAYVLPNDSPEHVRLEMQARHLLAIMGDRIIHSPVNDKSIKRALDIGCGTGVVTNYLARSYPSAEVIGLDLSPVPRLEDRPSNVHFVQGNIITDQPSSWQLDSNGAKSREMSQRLPDEAGFDLVYSRLLLAGMTEWPSFFQNEFHLLKSGGWAEVHDLDWIWYDKQGSNISDDWSWWKDLWSAGESAGLDFSCGSAAQQRMKDAGFVDVHVKTYRWPFGGQWEEEKRWQDFGDYVSTCATELVWYMIPRMMHGVSAETIDRMRTDMTRNFEPEEGKHWLIIENMKSDVHDVRGVSPERDMAGPTSANSLGTGGEGYRRRGETDL
ncbi:hypothetical protein LTR10_001948 [Elasticomyces elasticus]|nr:hypothetical protein LTR10_001948 [Elasticomyces elasticus]KAK4969162.1 hypothetical protein LTR42_009441 [Elasticomyces elasticus]